MKKKQSFSAKVLQRKAKRRDQRMQISMSIFLMMTWTLLGAWILHRESVRDEPTWAGFSTHDHFQETKLLAWDDGVPGTVLVNGQEWSIVRVSSFDDAKNPDGSPKQTHFNGALAETYCENQTIAYIPDENRSELRVNIVHEIFHAGACLHGGDAWWNSINPTGQNHPGVYHLGDFMAEFAMSNPDFMKWLSN